MVAAALEADGDGSPVMVPPVIATALAFWYAMVAGWVGHGTIAVELRLKHSTLPARYPEAVAGTDNWPLIRNWNGRADAEPTAP